MCSNLPLNATDCYLTSNPDASFFEHLVANYIPLGEHIVNAIDKVEEVLEEFQDILDEAKNEIYNGKDSGSCIVGNKRMIGMFESPGYPRCDLSLLLLADFDTHEMFSSLFQSLHLQRL